MKQYICPIGGICPVQEMYISTNELLRKFAEGGGDQIPETINANSVPRVISHDGKTNCTALVGLRSVVNELKEEYDIPFDTRGTLDAEGCLMERLLSPEGV